MPHKRVLLGWELGAGQGHLHFLAALARPLHDQGIECFFALKYFDLKGVELPGTLLAAPQLPFSGREFSYTYADILETFGFANRPLVTLHLQAWEELLQAVRPDLVVAESAPGLVLATYNRVPTMVVGSGFMVPPQVEEFPILRFPAPPESFEHQELVARAVRAATGFEGVLGALFNGDRSFIYSIPDLDPYHYLRTSEQYIGVHTAPLVRSPCPSPGTTWAYLAEDYPQRELVLSTLQPRSEFIPLPTRLEEKAIFVHHGGITTTTTCLLAGIPQLLLPRYLEQWLSGLTLEQLGVGKMLLEPTWESLVMTHAQIYGLAEAAAQQANKLSHWNQNLMPMVVNACLDQLQFDR